MYAYLIHIVIGILRFNSINYIHNFFVSCGMGSFKIYIAIGCYFRPFRVDHVHSCAKQSVVQISRRYETLLQENFPYIIIHDISCILNTFWECMTIYVSDIWFTAYFRRCFIIIFFFCYLSSVFSLGRDRTRGFFCKQSDMHTLRNIIYCELYI